MYSIEVTEQNFEQDVIEKSATVPVVVDFWAPWCGPCKLLKPILEKLAEEYQGKFILAKINSDNNQSISSVFNVRSIPSVIALRHGKVINEFTGALPESAVRDFLDKIIPNESEIIRQQAMSEYRLHKDNSQIALQTMDLLDKSIALDENNFQARIDKAEICTSRSDTETASDLLQKLPVAMQQTQPVLELSARIAVIERLKTLPDKLTLHARITNDESDLQAQLDLANHCIVEQDYDQAIQLLLFVLKRNRHFADGLAHKTLLDIFTLLGPHDQRVRTARRQLASLLN